MVEISARFEARRPPNEVENSSGLERMQFLSIAVSQDRPLQGRGFLEAL